jgi:replication factor C small subunit
MSDETLLWVDKYRPRKIAECILPDDIKTTFQNYANRKEVPHMILSGGPGMGKTTIARALCEEVGADYILMNGSTHGKIENIQTDVVSFATSMSFTGGRKVVIYDEADQLTAVQNGAQYALRGVIEEVQTNCSFLLTCNYKNKLLPAIQSRCPPIEFKIRKEDAPKLAMQFCKKAEGILKTEGVPYDSKAVIELVRKFFPDFRRILGELQRYASNGKIDAGIFASLEGVRIEELLETLRQKDFRAMRKWVGVNSDQDATRILRDLYDKAGLVYQPTYVPMAVTIIAKYMYWDAYVADHEVNLAAALTELMLECEVLQQS